MANLSEQEAAALKSLKMEAGAVHKNHQHRQPRFLSEEAGV